MRNLAARLQKLEEARKRDRRQLTPKELAAKVLGVYGLLCAGKYTLPANSKWPDVETFKAHMDDMFKKLKERSENKIET